MTGALTLAVVGAVAGFRRLRARRGESDGRPHGDGPLAGGVTRPDGGELTASCRAAYRGREGFDDPDESEFVDLQPESQYEVTGIDEVPELDGEPAARIEDPENKDCWVAGELWGGR